MISDTLLAGGEVFEAEVRGAVTMIDNSAVCFAHG